MAYSGSTKIDTKRIGFFVGAGASIEFGIPSMTQMTTTFAAKIRGKPEEELFNTIYDSLARVYGKDNVDLEAIMSVITGLKDKERLRDNIGELGLFLLERKGIEPTLGFSLAMETLDNLEQEFKKHIRYNVTIKNPEKIDLAREVYLDFFKQLRTVTNSNLGDDSNPEAFAAKWPIFTTNYDNVIEDFWVRDRGFHSLDLGFERRNDRKIMNADRFLLYYTEKFTGHGYMPLIKLHGSVNWTRERNDEIVEQSLFLSLDDVKSTSGSRDIIEEILIYPLSQKQLYFTPFIQLFRILEAELQRRDLWIIIGYSFRDIIIRTMFEKSMEKRKRKLLLVHPHANEQIKPLFQPRLRDQLTCMDTYFAKQDYENVNKEIAKALLSLAGT